MKAKEIKMHAAEKKHVDDKVNAAKEATERDVNQIEKRTEQAISNIQASALETIKAMKESMPNYDPSNENSAAVKKMHNEVQSLKDSLQTQASQADGANKDKAAKDQKKADKENGKELLKSAKTKSHDKKATQKMKDNVNKALAAT